MVWCNLRDSITNKHYYTISCHQPSEKTWTLSSKQNIITTARKYDHWDNGNITNLLGLESRKKYFMLEQIWKWLHNRMYWKSIFIPTKSEPISFIFSLTKRITKLTSLSPLLCSTIFYLIQNENCVSLCCVLPAAQWVRPVSVVHKTLSWNWFNFYQTIYFPLNCFLRRYKYSPLEWSICLSHSTHLKSFEG